MRRLGIFLFYDREGVVSDHVVYLLAKFSEHVERILVMSNGPVRAEHKERLAPYVDRVIERPNVGFDVGGYLDGILTVGFDELAEYDELVLFNYTVFGPFFDLGEMFGSMAGRDVDLWGVTEFTDRNKAFLQSYFLVTRRRLHGSSDFREYWLNMPEINSIEDSIHFHEFRFTPFFVERGYKKASYVGNDEGWQGNTTLVDLPGMIGRRNPVIKYRAFNFEPLAIERRGGLPAAFNFAFVREKTDYPIDLIWDYILSQGSSDQIIDTITGTRIITETGERSADAASGGDGEVIAFLSVEHESAVDVVAGYLAHLPPEKLYLASSSEAIVARAVALGWNAVKTSHAMTGIPIAAFEAVDSLVSDTDVVLNLSCFGDDRDTYYFRSLLADNYWGPLASSRATVRQIGRLFADDPRLGLLFAPTNSVAGRTRRHEPLCPRASNWTFDAYPADVRLAPDQSRWPWRGNAAVSGRLVRHAGFVRRLAELAADMKPVKGQKLAGPEGFMPELARRAGFASGLVVSARQAEKLATRHSAEERDARKAAAQFADKLNRDVAALRSGAPVAPAAGAATTAPPKKPSDEDRAKIAEAQRAEAEKATKTEIAKTKAALAELAKAAEAEKAAKAELAKTKAALAELTKAAEAEKAAKAELAKAKAALAELAKAAEAEKAVKAELAKATQAEKAAKAELSKAKAAMAELAKAAEVGRAVAAKAAAADGALAEAEASLAAETRRAEEALATLKVAEQSHRVETEEWKTILDRLAPAAIQRAISVSPRSDDAVDLTYAAGGRGASDRRTVEVPIRMFAFGRITEFRRDKNRIYIKGWCYDANAQHAVVFGTVTLGGNLVLPFAPCLRRRPNLRRKVSTRLRHEFSGFTFSAPYDSSNVEDSDLRLVLLDADATAAIVLPFAEAEFGSIPHQTSGTARARQD